MNVETPVGAWPSAAGVPPVPSLRGPAARTDQAAAAERCDRLLQDTLDAVRPALVWRHGAARSGAWLPVPGSGPDDAAVHWYAGRSRDILTIVSAARRAVLPERIEAHWRRRGWTVTSVNACRALPGLVAVTPDGYRLALEYGELGEARLTAVSPGVDRSEGWGGGEGSAQHRALVPEVCSPFWSAME
ncbi:hypothetical protein OH807_21990 [Kitasatospora sp. NBC_01560]|uniref:hypothetical protein n=1 Tax=Kitasatospora sp. NBC_01560 TaxID=2975965 RepID=UPI003862EA37